jgi:nitronate monooxygenase
VHSAVQANWPTIIQGGMGVGVSGWPLARAVSLTGQLGVVSGTSLDSVLIRRLQLGDSDGRVRRALGHFPDARVAERIVKRYFAEGGVGPEQAFLPTPMGVATPEPERQALAVAAAFVEVFLAKEGHAGVVGINLLEKIQMPASATLYGAMLAGVDYVLVGAGIPREIPGTLDTLARHEAVSPRLHAAGALPTDDFRIPFDPRQVCAEDLPPLARPLFLAIIASVTLAITLVRKANGRVDGFVIEGPTAGGHNAPPRGAATFNERGEPLYGPRDEVDLEKIDALGLPFWLAGSYGTRERVRAALATGAAGVQVGTAFALCRESGIDPAIKGQLIEIIRAGHLEVRTDPLASPTGFPFKVAQVDGSVARDDVYDARPRRCDLGYLREPYRKEDGTLGYRCAAEPTKAVVAMGGVLEETAGRMCLCNGLLATIGLPQRRPEGLEPPLVTIGDDVTGVSEILGDRESYSAADVVQALLPT